MNKALSELLPRNESLATCLNQSEARIRTKLERELGFILDFLQEDAVQEIFVNPDGSVWVDRAGEDRKHEGTISASKVQAFLSTVASSLNEIIDAKNPTIDGVLLLDGSRISGEIPPNVAAPSMRIRKHALHVEPLRYHLDTGVITHEQFELIREAIGNRRNIVVVGGTASGKTFLANSILHEVSALTPTDRVLTIEDTKELVVTSPDNVSWVTTPYVDMKKMLHRALRATPKRIVVGEVRGGEAYQLLKMWGTGHSGGLATIHSDKGAMDGLRRLERMCAESEELRGMGPEWIRETVGEVVHLLVNITRDEHQRSVPRLVRVDGIDALTGSYVYEVIER